MLKLRVIPTLLYKAPTLVKGKNFESWRRVGFPLQAVRVYNSRNVDELVILDIEATRAGHEPDYELIDDLADWCSMPLSVGGGITTIEHIRKLLSVGADKVIINSAAVDDPSFVKQAAEKFGTQCIIASIDYRYDAAGKPTVYSRSGTQETHWDPLRLAVELEKQGAGEIMLTCIDHEGQMSGYDRRVLTEVCQATTVQIIANGGAGNAYHMVEALEAGASAVSAASIFHFTEQTPSMMKEIISAAGFPVRQ